MYNTPEQVNKLYKALHERVEKGLVDVVVSGSLELFSYSRACQLDKKLWDEYILMARGLIIDRKTWKIVAKPFPKFFNYGEMDWGIPDEPFVATVKSDGSLGIVYYHDGSWQVATRGAFSSDQAQWATAYLNKNCKTDLLNKSYTYLVEIVYPANRIVIDYHGKEALVLLSAYDNETQKEDFSVFNKEFADAVGFEYVEPFECYSFKKLLELAETLPGTEEGWVVRFRNGYRVKIKGLEYKKIHKIIFNLTPLRIWEAVMNCIDLNKYKSQLPEEFFDEIDEKVRVFTEKFNEIYRGVSAFHEKTKHLSDREVGMLINNTDGAPWRRFVFEVRKKNWLAEVMLPGRSRENAFKLFRPDNNEIL